MAPTVSCQRKAFDLLARRDHFRAELAAKLGQRGYEAEEIETTLDRLVERGLLDDRRVARAFVADRQTRRGLGRRRLRAELARRGVSEEVADEVLAEIDDGAELPLARAAAERWLARRAVPDGDDYAARQRHRAALARHLERRGFAHRAIFAVLDEAVLDDAATGS